MGLTIKILMNEDETIPEVEQEQEINEVAVETPEETPEDTTDYKAEAAKWRAIAQRNRVKASQPLQTKQEPVDEDIIQTVKGLEMAEKKRQFGYENGLSPEETDKVFQISGGKPSKKTLEDPFIKAGIESLRASKRVEANTPSSSTSSKSYGGKSFSELDPKEKQKAWEEQMKGVRV